MDFVQIAENLPTLIGTATSAVTAIDAAIPAVDKLFSDLDQEAKADFQDALAAIKALVEQVEALFKATAAPAPAAS
jgi:ABC-type transporter Mla subunit MlaD